MRSRTPDEAVAEDLTAQVFFRALSSAKTFRGDGSYQAWLFQIAHNTLSAWRARKERTLVGIEDAPERPSTSPCPSDEAIEQDAGRYVWGKVAELPPAQQEVVKLRYLHDLTTREICRITKRSHGAVRVLLHRARTKLRHTLEGVDLR